MKIKIYFPAAALFLLLTLGACKDLDVVPPGAFGENILESEDGTNLIINNAYRQLALYEYYGRSLIYCSDLTSDDAEYIPGEITVPDRLALETFSWSAANVHTSEPYVSAYSSISVCNQLLDVVTEENPTGLGQGLYLRALNYFNLVRMYGGVPLFLTQDVDLEVFRTASRNSIDEVYDQILEDLERVVDGELLPRSWPQTENGRATEWAARALLARVYVTLASPGTDYLGSKAGFWEAAVEQLRFIRDNGPFSLEEDLMTLWTPESQYSNSEIIFQIGTNGVDQFLGGIPGRYTTSTRPIDRFGFEFGWGNNVPTTELYDSFDDEDQRKEAGFLTFFILRADTTISRERYERVGRSDNYTATGDVREFSRGDTIPFEFWQLPRIQRPHLGKFRFYGASSTPGSNVDDNNYPVIRYADVLLMLAEAINEVDGPTAEAYEAFNLVRRRAYNGSTAFDLEGGLGEAGFSSALQQERWKELHQEGIRWFDLVRWDIFRGRMASFGRTVEPFHKYYPLPQNQVDINPNLDQNPGY